MKRICTQEVSTPMVVPCSITRPSGDSVRQPVMVKVPGTNEGLPVIEKLISLGYSVSDDLIPLAKYKSYSLAEKLIFVSGQLPIIEGEILSTGKIGKEITDSEPEEDIATVIGAIIGSSIGSEIAAAKKEGVELLIETDSGNFISIIQEVGTYSFFKGQKVQIIKRNGKSRVIPFE